MGQPSGPAPRNSLTLCTWCNQSANRYTLYIAGSARRDQLPKTPYLTFLGKQLQLSACDVKPLQWPSDVRSLLNTFMRPGAHL
jgi:hypothetical protein